MGHGHDLALGVSEDVNENSGSWWAAMGTAWPIRSWWASMTRLWPLGSKWTSLGSAQQWFCLPPPGLVGRGALRRPYGTRGVQQGTHRALTLKFLPNQRCFSALFLPRAGTSVSKSASKPERSVGRNGDSGGSQASPQDGVSPSSHHCLRGPGCPRH